MNRPGRILIVDDNEEWCKELVETLQRGHFQADSVSSTAAALERLQKNLYHLLVLDIRMVDSDSSNQDGIDLLGELEKRGLSEATKVIMLSAYGTQEYMRTSFREYNVVDFLSKGQFDNEEFLHEVRHIFSEKMNINLALDIHWQLRVSGPEQVVLNLDLGGTLVKQDTSLHRLIESELDDLLCRLFRQATSILVRPLTPGWSGTGVLRVQPFYSTGGGGHEVIVKFGNLHKINNEYRNFTEYVQPFLSGGRNTTILAIRSTPHLAGITYSLLGSTNDQLVNFGEFYRRADLSLIKDALHRLFLNTCGAWYANRGQLELIDLAMVYGRLFNYRPEKLAHVIADQLRSLVQIEQQLTFKSLKGNRIFSNPLLLVNKLSLVRPSYYSMTHGDFNPNNLLVDSVGNMWLIDFQEAGPSHILRDIATLDSAIRFQLLSMEEATLEERLQMEDVLCSIQRFSQVEKLAHKFSTKNKPLAKAYETVVHLRKIAQTLVEQNPSDDISEYSIALLYNALDMLHVTTLSLGQREHALLSASLLVDQLGLGSGRILSTDISS